MGKFLPGSTFLCLLILICTGASSAQVETSFQSALPQGTGFIDVDFADQDNGTVVGDSGLIMHTTNGGATWVSQFSSTKKRLLGVSFYDKNNGFIVGESSLILRTSNRGAVWDSLWPGTMAHLRDVSYLGRDTVIVVGDDGTILRTNNRGESWFEQTSGTTSTLRAVSFVNADTGTVVGDNTILRTTDGGQTWSDQTSNAGKSSLSLYDVSFTDGNTGTAVGSANGNGIVLRTTDGGTTWKALLSDSPYKSFRGVSFISKNSGYIVGQGVHSDNDTTNAVILRTSDGGASWSSQPSGTKNSLLAVNFINTNRAVVVGDNELLQTTNGGEVWNNDPNINPLSDVSFGDADAVTAVGDGGLILHSTDAGETWINQRSGTITNLNGVAFTGRDSGTVVGDNGLILHTTNGGITWHNQSSGTDNTLRAVSFTDGKTGTAVGDSAILRTTDGGITWVKQTNDTTSNLYAVSFTDVNNGTAVGARNGRALILRTTDGGAVWNEQTIEDAGKLFHGVDFIYPNVGSVVNVEGSIYHTTDGGTTWTEQTNSSTGALLDIALIGWSNGIAVGNNGTILYTSNSGISWDKIESSAAKALSGIAFYDYLGIIVGDDDTIIIMDFSMQTGIEDQEREELQNTYTLEQNYPNPFNPSTIIEFNLPQQEFVDIKIYDVLGSEVSHLLSETLISGMHKVQWNADGFASGVYFYTINAGSFTETKKMVLLR